MAKKAKKPAPKKTTPKTKLKPAAKKPVKAAAKKSAAPKSKLSKPLKSKKAPARPAAKPKPAPKSIPSKAKAPEKSVKAVNKKNGPAKPIKTELAKAKTPERPKSAPAKAPAPEQKKTPAPDPKKTQAADPKKASPAKSAQKNTPPPPVSDEPEVPHIIKKGPPPPELKAQFNALKKKKLPPGEKRVVKTETVNPHVIKDKPISEKSAPKKEPKGKFTLEFILHAPVALLYDFLTTPNGLAEWFADEVDLKNDIYTFNWDGAIQKASIVSAKLDNYLRLHWLDKPEGTYFEFRIQPDELTNEIALLVTDFGESEDDVKTSRQLWDSQIHRLMKAMGTY